MFSISQIEDKLVAMYNHKVLYEITNETPQDELIKHIQLTYRLGLRDGERVL